MFTRPTNELYDYRKRMEDWLLSAPPKSKFMYHMGEHLEITHTSVSMKKIAWELALHGVVYLVQERVPGKSVFKYLLIKAGKDRVERLIPIDYNRKREFSL